MEREVKQLKISQTDKNAIQERIFKSYTIYYDVV